MNVISSGTKSSSCAHLASELEASLPFMCLSPEDFRLILRLIFLLERKVNVKLEPVPNALPNSNPFIRGSVVSRHAAAPINPCCWTSGIDATTCRCLQESWVLHAALTVPGATCWHLVEASTEDVAKLLAAVAEHQLCCIAELIADHACVVTAVILECVFFANDHGRVDIGDLLLVFDSILG